MLPSKQRLSLMENKIKAAAYLRHKNKQAENAGNIELPRDSCAKLEA